MLKKINFNLIFVILFCIILLYSFLLVGSPLQNNIQIANVCFNILCLIVIIKNIKDNNEIKLTKIDILILFLILVQFIPLIFRTQSSLSATIDGILKYIAVVNVFIITKYIIKIDKKYLNIITNIIIVASILLIIFGIDMMHDNVFQKFYDFLDTVSIGNASRTRMDSLYEYSNSFAVFLGVGLILSIQNILKTKNDKNKIKLCIYVLCSIFQLYGIVMSGSRLCLLMVIAVLAIWCILEKKQLFNKKVLIISSSIIAIVIITIILCFTVDTTLVLFDKTEEERSEFIKQINNVTPNTEYNFNFNISALNETNDIEKFKIIVRQLTKTAEKICEEEITFDTFEGEKNINILTTENTEMIRICFISRNNIKDKTRLEIKKLTMNGKELRLNYLFLPITFMNRIENIGINESSITERFVIIKDGIKLGMQKFFTGFGNAGWEYNYKNIRQYEYGATQMHCYIVDIFIQSGILGLITVIMLFIMLGIKIVKLIKNKQKEFYPIIFSIIFVFLHSLLDFDMNFYAILLLMYMFIAVVDSEIEENYIIVKKQRIVRIGVLILSIFILCINVGAYVAYKIDKNTDKDSLNYKNWEERYQKSNLKVNLAPYHLEYIEEKIELISYAKKSRYINFGKEIQDTYTDESIKTINKVIKNEQDRDIVNLYERLLMNYIEKLDANNVDYIIGKIDEHKENIAKKSEYALEAYTIYRELDEKLEEKNEELQNEKVQKMCETLKELMNEQQSYFLKPLN